MGERGRLLTDDELAAIEAAHRPHDPAVAGALAWTWCQQDNEPWPCDVKWLLDHARALSERVAALEAALTTAHCALDDAGCALTARGHPGWPNWEDREADAAFTARDAIERALDGAPAERGDAQAKLLAAQEWERRVVALERVAEAAREIAFDPEQNGPWDGARGIRYVSAMIPADDMAALHAALDALRTECADGRTDG